MPVPPTGSSPSPRHPTRRSSVPGSKSITNRALVCAALADGASTLRGVGRSDDTEAMARLHRPPRVPTSAGGPASRPRHWSSGRRARCGPVRWSSTPAWPARRHASSPRWPRSGHGRYRLDGGEPPARTRPMAAVARRPGRARRRHRAGVGVGSPPGGGRRPAVCRGGAVAMPGDVSSQFVTALMLVAPATERGHRDRADLPAGVPPVPRPSRRP